MEPSSIVARYLDAIGLRTAQTLAVFFTSAQHIRDWMKRFQTGVATGTHNFKIEEETALNVQTACLISIWQNCPSPPVATTPPASTSPAPAPAASSTTEDKPPKSLPPGVWQQLLTEYNQQKINGENRQFPERQILGADKITARIWHEHKHKTYTCLGLGEIIIHRTYTALGKVNSTARDRKADKTLTLGTDNHTLAEKTPSDWSPQSLLMILDSLESIRWAWIFIQLSSEHQINTYIDKFINMARTHSRSLPNVKEAWESCGWQIAMQLRNGSTFEQATTEIY